MSEPEHFDVDGLKRGPIRHESLPPDLLGQIGAVYQHLGPYLGTTLEEFEIGFMRDMHPESEVSLWCGITKAWLAYHEDHLENNMLPIAEEKQLIGALLLISSGVDDVNVLGLPADVGRKLIACYRSPGLE